MSTEPSAFQINISTTNAAFHTETDGDWNGEVSRILHDIADRIAAGNRPKSEMDFNGNTVAQITYTEE